MLRFSLLLCVFVSSSAFAQSGGGWGSGNGKMTALHLANSSKSMLIVSKYSGRPDPAFPLENYLKDAETKQKLEDIAKRALRAPPALDIQVQRMSNLGYRGIVIDDREGLVSPKGMRMQIFDNQVLAYPKYGNKPVWFEMEKPLALERSFAKPENY